MPIQLEGPITIGGTDYSDYLVTVEITRRRDLSTKPPTFGNARTVQKAGGIVEEVRINALNDTAAAALSQELWDAIDTDSGELAFTARFDDAAVGTDNPTYSGTFVVTGATVGGTVGQQNTQQWTFPITDAGITVTTA